MSNKITHHELFILWCLHTNARVCTTYYIFQILLHVANSYKALLLIGHIITTIALHFHASDPSIHHMATFTPGTLNHFLLCRAEIITDNMDLRERNTRRCYLLRRNSNCRDAIDASDDEGDNEPNADEDMVEGHNEQVIGEGDNVGWHHILARFHRLEMRMDARFDELHSLVNTLAQR